MGGRAGGPWVSPGRVVGGLLSSQMASELLLAARSERFPAKVQLGSRGCLVGKAPPTPRISQMGPEPGQV